MVTAHQLSAAVDRLREEVFVKPDILTDTERLIGRIGTMAIEIAPDRPEGGKPWTARCSR